MALNNIRFQRSWKNANNNKKKVLLFSATFLVLCIGGLLIWLFLSDNNSIESVTKQDYQALWEKSAYADLNELSYGVLESDPFDLDALLFAGFSDFYLGITQVIHEEKLHYIDNSIFRLRKLKTLKSSLMSTETSYILGKAYYHKGHFYADLCIKYLLEALEQGFVRDDIYEYLGLAFSEIGKYRESIEYFEKSMELHESSLLYLTIAQSYYNLGNVSEAENYLLRINKPEDEEHLRLQAKYLLAEIYFERGDFQKAKTVYNEILSIDDHQADAHFQLGEIYFNEEDQIKARAEWRKALRANPNHFGALRRLYD